MMLALSFVSFKEIAQNWRQYFPKQLLRCKKQMNQQLVL